jgi:hypothetical protein
VDLFASKNLSSHLYHSCSLGVDSQWWDGHQYRMCDTVSIGTPHLQVVGSSGKNLE